MLEETQMNFLAISMFFWLGGAEGFLKFIYLWCVESSLLCTSFLWFRRAGATLVAMCWLLFFL